MPQGTRTRDRDAGRWTLQGTNTDQPKHRLKKSDFFLNLFNLSTSKEYN